MENVLRMNVGNKEELRTEFVMRQYFSERLATALELFAEDLNNGVVAEHMLQNCTITNYPGCEDNPDQWVIEMTELVEEVQDKSAITYYAYAPSEYDDEEEE